MSADLVGQTLAHFRIEARLGEGGMGVVYAAHDEKLRRIVALKVLPPDFAADDERRKRFLREARAAAAVTHPNIAAIYDVGEVDGRIYIAMERVEGKSLRDWIEAAGRVPVDRALRITREIARGLVKAHDAGIVHRGDTAGACDAYRAVLAHWGDAKPKSVTADAARTRIKVLACR